LRCVFQRLEGEATREGLWLTSTVIPLGGTVNDRFRLLAVEVGRGTPGAPSAVGGAADRSATSTINIRHQLSATGNVPLTARACASPGADWWRNTPRAWTVCGRILWWWSVRPAWASWSCGCPKRARVESAAFGAQVVLANSGRKIAYGRLKVTDADGRELPARMEVATAPESKIENQKSEILRVVVNDAEAVYPVRIDPTFSDANWNSMGGIPGADNTVSAVVVDVRKR